ncbi:alkylhydroperoxidase [Oleiphilus messinensis]|uniref:Alkylhydroperoxidase n=1 Tax=Oleiphilus messinensis TaxID=141451 RepID=A0A1Y0ID22_9GAMM|nr:carboxymuconolactone decarboxylase family protein [Oleiphilus messinensis]ARU58452.1 alkylhydroperoxidase [Oleiphilus messinensis]
MSNVNNATRIKPVATAQAPEVVQSTLSAVKAKLGMVPNMFATMAHSPELLHAYLTFSETLGSGQLTAAERELIALTVGQENRCGYCLSAHTVLGKQAGLSADDIQQARNVTHENSRNQAIVTLAHKILVQKGVLTDADLADAAEAGIDTRLTFEILGNVVLNILTNYTNHIADTEIDFPEVSVDA